MYLRQQLHNLLGHCIELYIYSRQIARRLVLVEMAVEGDFVSDDTDLAILGIALTGIYPGVWYKRVHSVRWAEPF